jgi:Phytanoyl-CoA dioxygenase (PhyH)
MLSPAIPSPTAPSPAIPSTDRWFNRITAESHLTQSELNGLLRDGFTVIPGPYLAPAKLSGLYDDAVRKADPADVSIGSSTTRVTDLVTRTASFDALYLHPPLLEACCRIIGQPFKLSSMQARTLWAESEAQDLHVDFAADAAGWPMVGFIYMIDDFSSVNGATCFVPASQGEQTLPDESRRRVSACGPAGSIIVFNGSVWHGHAENWTSKPRRSVQGGFIRRTAKSAIDFAARMGPTTCSRLSPLAKYLLACDAEQVKRPSEEPIPIA